jgi:hypothetical protein
MTDETNNEVQQEHHQHHQHHDQQQQFQFAEQQMQQVYPGLETIMNATGLSQEQALALHGIHMQQMQQQMPHMLSGASFPRPTVKRRKPVKWEHWEEKNLIEGVRKVRKKN